MVKVPKSKYQIGDLVWVNCSESEINPFEAIVISVSWNHRRTYKNSIEYTLLEDPESGKMTSDGWTEDMLSKSYPR